MSHCPTPRITLKRYQYTTADLKDDMALLSALPTAILEGDEIVYRVIHLKDFLPDDLESFTKWTTPDQPATRFILLLDYDPKIEIRKSQMLAIVDYISKPLTSAAGRIDFLFAQDNVPSIILFQAMHNGFPLLSQIQGLWAPSDLIRVGGAVNYELLKAKLIGVYDWEGYLEDFILMFPNPESDLPLPGSAESDLPGSAESDLPGSAESDLPGSAESDLPESAESDLSEGDISEDDLSEGDSEGDISEDDSEGDLPVNLALFEECPNLREVVILNLIFDGDQENLPTITLEKLRVLVVGSAICDTKAPKIFLQHIVTPYLKVFDIQSHPHPIRKQDNAHSLELEDISNFLKSEMPLERVQLLIDEGPSSHVDDLFVQIVKYPSMCGVLCLSVPYLNLGFDTIISFLESSHMPWLQHLVVAVSMLGDTRDIVEVCLQISTNTSHYSGRVALKLLTLIFEGDPQQPHCVFSSPYSPSGLKAEGWIMKKRDGEDCEDYIAPSKHEYSLKGLCRHHSPAQAGPGNAYLF